MNEHTRTLTVKNIEQKIIFLCEMQGQISDGKWEDASPHDHYHTWCDLNWETVLIGDQIGTKQIGGWEKRNYNFSNRDLLDIVGDRIRFKIALLRLHPNKELFLQMLVKDAYAIPDDAIEFDRISRPETQREEFWRKKFETNQKFGITKELCEEAQRLMDSLYSKSALKEDCKGLKDAFKTLI